MTGLVRIKGQAQGRDVEHESDPCATGPAQGRVAGAVVRLSPTPATAAVPRLVLRPCGWSSVGAAAVTGVGLDVENATDTAVTILGMDQPARIEPGHSERLVGSFASVRTLAVLERPAWTAKVLVGPELGVAVTDGRGRFEFAGLPEGAYTVSARNGIAGDSSAAVQVGSEAGYADLEIDDITVVNRNTCRIAVGDSVIARACREGGRRRARFVMTSMVRAVRSEHVRLDCDGCHTNEADYSLSENAVQDFKALAALYARLRRR